MTSTPSFLMLFVLAGLVLVVLIALYRRERQQRRRQRSQVFAPAYDLFDSYRVEQSGVEFPVLSGRYRGHAFLIDTVIDTMTFRKLPVLWLRVSLLTPIEGIATTDIMVRVQNTEFYGPGNDLPFQLSVPSDWPPGSVVKTADPAQAPAIDLLRRHLDFFAADQAKEILVTPKGVRLVGLLDQGRRPEYLVMRAADFRESQVSAILLRDIMDRCIALAEDLGTVSKATSRVQGNQA
ncbi:MAG: hypothetical protein JNL25_16425 [Rhodospirillaceae bacterium]|nr:hypothetical protein [Rhodospirillaceae bacterium]